MGNCSFRRIYTPVCKAYINKHKPNLIFISYGETDDFAHDGDYESYLKSTKNTDALIKDLWEFYQGNSYYKDKTTFIITTDHGRGINPIDSWKSHGKEVTGSDETWLIIFGKGVKARGEVANNQIYNNQIAPLIRKTNEPSSKVWFRLWSAHIIRIIG